MSTPIPSAHRLARPGAGDCTAFYLTYIARVPDGDIVDFLRAHGLTFAALVAALPDAVGTLRYAAGKWSVRDVVAHVIDAERVFAYRLLRFARGDETALPGYDENRYAPESFADQRSNAALAAELSAVRAATVALIESLVPHAWERAGRASDARVTVRALAWIIAGHALHHELLLRERYLADVLPALAAGGPAG